MNRAALRGIWGHHLGQMDMPSIIPLLATCMALVAPWVATLPVSPANRPVTVTSLPESDIAQPTIEPGKPCVYTVLSELSGSQDGENDGGSCVAFRRGPPGPPCLPSLSCRRLNSASGHLQLDLDPHRGAFLRWDPPDSWTDDWRPGGGPALQRRMAWRRGQWAQGRMDLVNAFSDAVMNFSLYGVNVEPTQPNNSSLGGHGTTATGHSAMSANERSPIVHHTASILDHAMNTSEEDSMEAGESKGEGYLGNFDGGGGDDSHLELSCLWRGLVAWFSCGRVKLTPSCGGFRLRGLHQGVEHVVCVTQVLQPEEAAEEEEEAEIDENQREGNGSHVKENRIAAVEPGKRRPLGEQTRLEGVNRENDKNIQYSIEQPTGKKDKQKTTKRENDKSRKDQHAARRRRQCMTFMLDPSPVRHVVVAMATVGGAVCVMLVLICLLVAYITENMVTPPDRKEDLPGSTAAILE
uniref:fibronectin type III domain-containing protein 10 n=1 Tax=Myxine glutinosa TaxID=7769 RepID=UPI00358FA118